MVESSFEVDEGLALVVGVVIGGACGTFLFVCPIPFGTPFTFPLTCGEEIWEWFRFELAGLAV